MSTPPLERPAAADATPSPIVPAQLAHSAQPVPSPRPTACESGPAIHPSNDPPTAPIPRIVDASFATANDPWAVRHLSAGMRSPDHQELFWRNTWQLWTLIMGTLVIVGLVVGGLATVLVGVVVGLLAGLATGLGSGALVAWLCWRALRPGAAGSPRRPGGPDPDGDGAPNGG